MSDGRVVRSRVGQPLARRGDSPGSATGHGDGPGHSAQPGSLASYYDIPFLKPPTWDWRVASYFFFESVSSGASLISSLAGIAAGDRFPNVQRAGSLLAFATFVPCAPLLIWDLGRPERFLHMLRMFKRTSAMSHGSWTLALYGVPAAALAARHLPEFGPPLSFIKWTAAIVKGTASVLPARPLEIAGVPCALMLSTYPGVLLSTTANPLWSQTRLLGALFACSAVHTGAVSVALALRDAHSDERSRVERIAAIAAAAEVITLAALVGCTGRHAAPLVRGRVGRLFLIGAVGAGIVAPLLLRALAPRSGRLGRLARLAAGALSLVGSLTLKTALVYAGHAAAHDARAGHDAARAPRT